MDKIYSCLIDVGVHTNLKGFDYLHDAIDFVLKDKEFKNDIIGLYDKIANCYNESKTSVERCIRHAIKSCFQEDNYSKIRDIFGENVAKRARIKNGEFIATLYYYLK